MRSCSFELCFIAIKRGGYEGRSGGSGRGRRRGAWRDSAPWSAPRSFLAAMLPELSSRGTLDGAQGTGAGHRPRTPAQGHGPGLRHLLDAQRSEDGQQRLQLLGGAGRLEGHGVGVDVDDPGAEELGGLEDLGALGHGRTHLHQQQFALHGGSRVELDDLDDLDQLVQLLGDLLQRLGLRVDDDRHPREVGVLRGADGEGLDVEPAPAEQRRDAGQDTGLVLDQDRERVTVHCRRSFHVPSGTMYDPVQGPAPSGARGGGTGSYICPSPKTGRTSRAARMSSLLAPAATIGHTWASCPTTKSMTTGASLMDMAFSMTASTSSLVSHRRPTQPSASARTTKSGMRTGFGVPSALRACSFVFE